MLKHPWDYFLHFSVSFIGFFVLYILLRKIFSVPSDGAVVIAVAGIFLLGLFKELYIDMNVGKTDMVWDMLANIAGIALALLIKIRFMGH